jgi:hypothetical protein
MKINFLPVGIYNKVKKIRIETGNLQQFYVHPLGKMTYE